ncbi:MAG TPA: SRPBCC family protein, partial [Opitutus sp.]|nr:SRPBCC family protein [Opitutus sp.]
EHDRSRVFSALTDPVKMAQWFFAYRGGRATVTSDFRPGGRYEIAMTDGKETCAPHGTYLEIVPPAKLVFTWLMDKLANESKVTIELFERGAGTRLVITHELPEDQVGPHEAGWNNCFDHLEAFLAAATQPPR